MLYSELIQTPAITPVNPYILDVLGELSRLDSGQKIHNAVCNGWQSAYITEMIQRGFTASHTASHLRDYWYGV